MSLWNIGISKRHYVLPLVYSALETLWEGESEGEMEGAFERTRDFAGELGPSAYMSLSLILLSAKGGIAVPFSVLCPSFDLPDRGDKRLL